MLWFLTLALASEPSVDALPVDPAPRSVLYWWKHLRDHGCDLPKTEQQPWPPFVLRVVRNTPYALRGRTFSSSDLAAFFGAYDWYQPVPDAPLPSAEEQACVQRLLEQEQARRAAHPVPEALEARLMREGFPRDYLKHVDRHWGAWTLMTTPEATWYCNPQEGPSPVEGYPCIGGGLVCPNDGSCRLVSGP